MPPTANALDTRPGFVGRIRLRVEQWVRQMLAPIDVPFSSGTAFAVQPGYSQRTAMSSLAAFPWVRACVRARCDDVGGLPLVAVSATGSEQRDDHPFLVLMRKPSPGVTETMLRRQLEADLALAGNAYLWLRAVGDWWELHRLHPEHMRADVRDGRLVRWVYGGARIIPVSQVFHFHDVSWADDLTALYGESAIRTLDPGLRAVQAAREHATKSANRGRPDMVFTFPKDAGLGDDAAQAISNGYEESMANGRRCFVVGGGVTGIVTSWSPKDIEFAGLDDRVRDETLAVLRVPPTRAGVPQANFAVAKAELRDYWNSLVNADLKLFEDGYTAIAHAVGGNLDEQIQHDTSAVEALQSSYDQRQARAGFWVTVMGGDPAEAAAFEGFRNAPVGNVAGGQPASRPAVEVDDQPARQSMLERAIAAWLAVAAERMQGGGIEAESEVYRLAGVLELARVSPDEALEVAREVAAITCELAESVRDRSLAELYAFSPAYARTIATRPRLALAAK